MCRSCDRRHHLAGCILIADALTEIVSGKIYAVRVGAAPACMLRLDLEDERELNEAKPDSRIDEILKPLHDHICKPTTQLLSASGNVTLPSGPVYFQDFSRTPPFCSCPDHIKRGETMLLFYSVSLFRFLLCAHRWRTRLLQACEGWNVVSPEGRRGSYCSER